MVPKPIDYDIWPSIVKANETTELTVLACENCFMPWKEKEYFLTIHPMNQDGMDYHMTIDLPLIPLTNQNSVLKASYAFGAEGDYWVDLIHEGKVLCSMHVYALEEDLYGLRPLKGDLHAHSYRSDAKRDPAALAGHYREQGYDFFALTDHNRYYPCLEAIDAYKDVKLGITILKGEEIHTPPSVVHVVHVGGKSSVADIYQKEPERYEAEWKEFLKEVPEEVPEDVKERYAQAMWACREVHKAEGLAIFVHPFWRTVLCNCYNMSNNFAKLLIKSGAFDAYEVHGGMKWDGNNMSLALWNDLLAQGVKIPLVASSDVHATTSEDHHFSYIFTIVLAKDNTPEAIMEAVRKGNTIAVERVGTAEKPEFRCVGSLRMVIYAQFLLAHYFPRTQRIAEGEGVMMRRYLIGAESSELLSACADRVSSFWRRFVGIDTPIVPSAEIIEKEEKWRAIHLQGPITRGNTITYNKNVTNKRQD